MGRACELCIKQACLLVDQVPWHSDAQMQELATLPGSLTIRRTHRKVEGMRELMHSRHHKTSAAWQRTWETMLGDGTLHEPWDKDTHDLSDIALFCLWYVKRRRQCASRTASTFQDMAVLRAHVVGYLSRVLARHFTDSAEPEIKNDRKANALVSPQKCTHTCADSAGATAPRKYVVVQPEAVWSIIEESRREGCSLEQVVGIRAADDHVGCAKSNCTEWRGRLADMYRHRRKMALDNVYHLSICADPATHCRQEVQATLVWSWEAGTAAHGDLQVMGSSNTLLLEESLPDHLSLLAAQGRLERTAAYRQLQAWSNCIQGLGHWPRGLEEFVLPDDMNVRAVERGEVRVVQQWESTATAWRIDQATGFRRPLLPPETLAATQGFKCVVLGLDQGSIGAAGIAYADSSAIQAMIHCKWDKFHRVIRDMRLSITHASSGVFLKTQLFTTYIWSVNQKPFGTGCFLTQKNNLLNVFLAVNGIDSPVFCKFVDRIAHDLGLPCETQAEKQCVFDALLPNAKSFSLARDMPKTGRWFSWNCCAHQQLREYWIMKMVLEDQYKDMDDPDEALVAFSDVLRAATAKTPQAELAQLKAANGGLRLALRLMTTELWTHAKILYIATRACWSWYAKQVKNITTPKRGLQQTLASTQGRWRTDHHVAATVCDTMLDTQNMEYMGIAVGDLVLAERVASLVWSILSNRAWSLAVRHQGPPECYAGLLSSSHERQQAALELLRNSWQAVIRLEQRRLDHAPAMRLWTDIQFLQNTPIRLLHCLFESAKYSASCPLGRHLPGA